jgi:hypothetical protein
VTPYGARLDPSLQGGVRQDIALGTVDADTAALQAAQAQAEAGERRRRDLAAQAPGLGALVSLPEPYADAGQGSPPVAGEGYAVQAPPQPWQVTSEHGPLVYGQRPAYADPSVGGTGFTAGKSEPAIRALTGQRSRAADSVTFVSPPARPSLWRRLLGRR